MTTPPAPVRPACVDLGPEALRHLRGALERHAPEHAAAVLQEAGFAGGAGLAAAFGTWVSARYGVAEPGDLDVRWLAEALAGFLGESGWGTVAVEQVSPAVLALSAPDWAEATPDGGAPWPSCHLSSGLLAELLVRATGADLGVLEVECRSRGDERCRFAVAAPATLAGIYERLASGAPAAEALAPG